jgi:hypothetical protein
MSILILSILIPLAGLWAVVVNDAPAAEVEAKVRGALYEGVAPRIEPEVREVDGERVRVPPDRVVVPAILQELYKKNPEVVVEVLLRVADGARPTDSITAAAFALSLVDSPQVAVVIVEVFKAETYDTLNESWKQTPRQHWIDLIRQKTGKQ